MPDRPARPRRGLRDARGPRPALPTLPEGPVPIATGTVELQRDRGVPTSVTVLVNGVPSSHVDLEDQTRLEFEYMQQMATVLDTLPPGPVAAVHLGAAACSLPRWVEARRRGSRQLAVDIDAELLTLVRQWFDLPRSPRLRLRPGEAREVLATLPDASADVIVRDVFAGISTPPSLCTRGFVSEVRRVLRPGGLYLANCADRPPLTLAKAEAATIRSVLATTAVVAEPGQLRGRRYGNVVLAATAPGRAEHGTDLASPALGRALRSLAIPSRLLHGSELDAFLGDAAVLDDPEPDDDPPSGGRTTGPHP